MLIVEVNTLFDCKNLLVTATCMNVQSAHLSKVISDGDRPLEGASTISISASAIADLSLEPADTTSIRLENTLEHYIKKEETTYH